MYTGHYCIWGPDYEDADAEERESIWEEFRDKKGRLLGVGDEGSVVGVSRASSDGVDVSGPWVHCMEPHPRTGSL